MASYRAGTLAVLSIVVLSACAAPAPVPPSISTSAPDPMTAGPATPATSVRTPTVRPLTVSTARPLETGRYMREGFAPALSLELAGPWYAVQALPGFFDVQRDPGTLDVIAVQFARPSDATTVAAAVEGLQARDDLIVGEPEPVTMGGLPGTRVLLETTDPDIEAERFVQVLRVPAGPLSIASGRRLQVDFFDTADGLIAVLLGGSVREWQRTQEAADPVLRSIRLGR